MELNAKKVIILVENFYNDREFWYPYYRLKEAGTEVLVVGPAAGILYTGASGIQIKSEAAEKVNPAEFDGMVIPGGYAPDHMRRHPAMVELVKNMVEADKVVAAICHAGWMLASAGVLKGKTVTSFFAIKDDMVHAGANYVDREVAIDGNIITSRTPDDLPAFMKAIIAALSS